MGLGGVLCGGAEGWGDGCCWVFLVPAVDPVVCWVFSFVLGGAVVAFGFAGVDEVDVDGGV